MTGTVKKSRSARGTGLVVPAANARAAAGKGSVFGVASGNKHPAIA